MGPSDLIRVAIVVLGMAVPAAAQITVLDQAQDQGRSSAPIPAAPLGQGNAGVLAPEAAPLPTPCGTQPMTIARMNWPSAAVLAEIHVRLLNQEFGCEARVIPGDLAATASSMGSTGQPAVAPEMWVTRITDVWNGAIDAQMVRSAAPTYGETALEGWFVPAYMADASGNVPTAATLGTLFSSRSASAPVRFISCPPDWACAVINRHLIEAHGLSQSVQLVEPANRFEMDALIAEAVSRRESFVFYYWQPNAVLAQLDFTALDMGGYDEEAMKCLAALVCSTPRPSAFPPDLVVSALSEWVFAEAPAVAGYFQRATMPIAEMNALLAEITEQGATVEAVAEKFVSERADVWELWVGAAP